MDLQTGFLCLVIAIVSSVIIYIISISSVKENSFEEAKAKRRKLMKQYIEESRQTSEKAKEKKSKKAKKAKEKHVYGDKHVSSPDIDSLTEDEKENLQAESHLENVIKSTQEEVKQQEDVPKKHEQGNKVKETPKNTSIKETTKDVPNKEKKEGKKTKAVVNTGKSDSNQKQGKGLKESTKLNTLDANAVLSQKEVPSNSIKIEPLIGSNPDKSASLKNHEHGHVVEENAKEAKLNKEDITETTPTEAISQISVKEIQNKSLQLTQKGGKKKKNDVVLQQLKNDKDAVNMSLLMPLLQKAELSKSEIQLLIDVLLNKQQQESSEWLLGRQDPLVKLRKQLAEKEELLSNEQHATLGLQAKLKELRSELNLEKSAIRMLEEAASNKHNECTALSAKLKKTTEESQSLLVKTQKLQQQLNEEHILVAKLKEEQNIQPKLHIAHEQQQHEIHALKGHVSQMAAELQEQQTVNNDLIAENEVLQESLRISEGCSSDLKHHLNTALLDNKRLQDQTIQEQDEIKKTVKTIQNLKSEKHALQEKNEQISKQLIAACQEQRRLVEINEELAAKENKENGDLSYHDKHSEFGKVIEEKDAAIMKLHSELKEKDIQIEKLNNEIIYCKNEANKKQTTLENATSEMIKLRSQAAELISELAEKKNEIAQLASSLSEKLEEIKVLKRDLETHKQRNNELRNKNWKVVEALTNAEQALQTVGKGFSTDCIKPEPITPEAKLRVTHLFQRVFPEISIDNSQDSEAWLKKLEQVVSEEENQLKDSNKESNLEIQNTRLHSMIAQYKATINETEGFLKRLQSHIEIEETRWSEKLQAQQKEIDLLKTQLTKGKDNSDLHLNREFGHQV